MKKRLAIEIICFLIILLFSYAAISKLTEFQDFRAQLGQSPMLTAIAQPIAIFTPVIELIVAILLMWPKFRLLALYCSFCIMVVFTTYIIIILNFSPFVPCSCGGVLERMTWTQHLVFNVFFVLISMIGIFLHVGENRQSPEQESDVLSKQTSRV